MVLLWIPNSRSIARSDIPLRLAFWIAFHRSLCRNVGLCGEVALGFPAAVKPLFLSTGSFSFSIHASSGLRVAVRRSPRPWAPEAGTGTGEAHPWPFRRNTGLGAASCTAMRRLHAAPTTGRPVLPGLPQSPRRSWGVPARATTGGCATGISPCCPWPPSCCASSTRPVPGTAPGPEAGMPAQGVAVEPRIAG